MIILNVSCSKKFNDQNFKIRLHKKLFVKTNEILTYFGHNIQQSSYQISLVYNH